MDAKQVYVGVNWDPELTGYVTPALALQSELMIWLGLK